MRVPHLMPLTDATLADYTAHWSNSQAPLPSTMVLLGSGLAGLAFYRKRRAVLKG
jgi:hypothetical protein